MLSFSRVSGQAVISYPPAAFNLVVGTPVTITPTNTGTAVSTWTVVVGPLPAGLTMSGTTGVITGTPTAVTAATSITIWAYNAGFANLGTTTIAISVGATAGVPVISYAQAVNDFLAGGYATISPSNTGGGATNWSISPAVPAGFSFSATTGVLTELFAGATLTGTYTITATNAAGSGTTTITIGAGNVYVWTGAGANALWSTGANWSGNTAPTLPTDIIQIGVGGNTYTGFQPTISAAATVSSIEIGPNTGHTAPTLTVTGVNLVIGTSLTVDAAATATITGTGSAELSAGALLTITGNGKLIQSLTAGFTLRSTTLGSASVGQLTTGTITGTFNVERFLTGGSGHRGYYLLSSPVYKTAVGLNNVYDLHYLSNAMFLTGRTGFDATGNPSIYLYREDKVPDNTTFVSGNWSGVSKFNNTNVYDYNLNQTGTIYNVPVGNGYQVFFRGSKVGYTVLQETTPLFTLAPSATLSASGSLNTGAVTVRDWFTPGSGTLSYTTGIANGAVRGFNLAGNPYASSIDWETFSSTTSTAGIYGVNISNTVYEYNILSHNYDTYQVGGGSTNNGSRIIVSGQGFFVLATAASPTLTFNETAKVSIQNFGATLFMSTRAAISRAKTLNPNSHLRLQLAKDSINKDDMYVGFSSDANAQYVFNEDALYNPGLGQVGLYSFSSDNVGLAINKIPLPTTAAAAIRLNVKATASGTYNLNMLDVSSIPDIYEIWLKDAYANDSLDMRHNKTYAFNLNLKDTTTYGAHRFSLVVRQTPARQIHLLDFTAAKSGTGVRVAWKVENEYNYTGFTVEKSTGNGSAFTSLGMLTSSGQGTYSLLDTKPAEGTNQYRLKITDLNGTVTYSKIVSLLYSHGANTVSVISVYPNPAKSIVHVVMPSAGMSNVNFNATQYGISELVSSQTGKAEEFDIVIVNNQGAVVKKATVNQAEWQTDVSSLMPGTYVIRATSKSGNGIAGQSTFVKL